MATIDAAYTRHIGGDLAGAETLYWSMIDTGEDVLSAANNLYALLRAAGRSSDLIRLYEAIEPALPGDPAWCARFFNRPLAEGDYDAGWRWHEARRHAHPDLIRAPAFPFPEWRGEPVSRLLVWPEQGFGDMIQFARYVPILAGRGVDVTLACHPALARLFSALPARVVPIVREVQLPAQDRWVLAGSLALRCGPPFAPPPPAAFQTKPSRSGGIGVMPAASRMRGSGLHRSLPPALAAALLEQPGAICLAPEATHARDFQDTADIIAGLDLVITVDTAVAHLAGSLGKRTWVLLSSKSDGRWQRDREDSPLYPAARLFRQTTPGEWRDVIQRVTLKLERADVL